ncbi:MAG TPA: MarR family transcriptional regulator [Blastocatellia bacterium]|nr:MarR family transcriptional regulator [Blastocatellia bacterium]
MKAFLIPKDVPKHEALKAHAARYPDLDPSAVEACIALVRVAGEMVSAFGEHFARHGTSQGRFIILVLLNRDPDQSLSPSALAEMSSVTRATITGLLDGLESDGLVRRVPTASDRRSHSVCLTAKGKRFMNKMLPDHFRRMAGMMSNLNENERMRLIQLLYKVGTGLDAVRLP